MNEIRQLNKPITHVFVLVLVWLMLLAIDWYGRMVIFAGRMD